MKCLNLHAWDLQYSEAMKLQRQLKERLILEAPKIEPELVAGADVSYSKGSNIFFSSVVVLEMPSRVAECEEKKPYMNILEEANAEGRMDFPYIPGLLSFREAPILIKAFEKVKNVPDVIIFDGQGTAHPRGLGLASHMGLILDLPSIGCAKKNLVGNYDPVGTEVGAHTPIIFKGNVVGAVLRTKRNVSPVFVSPGHKMDIPSAIDIVMKTCRGYKLPEPTRQAHLSVNRFRASHGSTQSPYQGELFS